jgi:hypothetical protein
MSAATSKYLVTPPPLNYTSVINPARAFTRCSHIVFMAKISFPPHLFVSLVLKHGMDFANHML